MLFLSLFTRFQKPQLHASKLVRLVLSRETYAISELDLSAGSFSAVGISGIQRYSADCMGDILSTKKMTPLRAFAPMMK